MRLEGRVAVVTGAGRGLGKAFAIALAQEGASVVINAFSETAIETTREIVNAGGKAVASIGDVSDWDYTKKLIDMAVNTFGKIDVLVNNAAFTIDKVIWKMSEEEFDRCIAVSLKGKWLCCRHAVPYMREQGYGKIINLTSASGLKGYFGQSNYASAKAGIVGLTKTLAKELGKYNIQVNCVSPRAITRNITEPAVMKNLNITEVRENEALTTSTALGKIRTPDAVAPLVVFLASSESDYMTGQIIGMDGGVAGL